METFQYCGISLWKTKDFKTKRCIDLKLDKIDLSCRTKNSFCFNIKKGKFKNAQKRIRDFIDDFISEFEASDNESNETYHINIQLFSLIKKGELQ